MGCVRFEEKLIFFFIIQVKTVNMVGIALLVFVHRRDIEYVTNVEAISTPTGIAGIWVRFYYSLLHN